ncbi:MAG: enoyl-CoA hydratase-related protein [Syntrophaceae bacterium]
MSSGQIFRVENEGPIAWVVLNRPEKRNTLTLEFFSGLTEIFRQLDSDPETAVVVIRAEGRDFTVGLDLTEAAAILNADSAGSREEMRRRIEEIQESMNSVEKCRKPVIAAVQGYCIGGGVDLLCACDIRIAARDAVFSIRETRIGIIADLGTLQRMPHIVGYGWFNELALTGRNFTAGEALQMGFVTRICENGEELAGRARELAGEIVQCPPLAVEGVKDVALYSRDNGIYPGLKYVAQKNAAVLPNEDVVEAFQAFLEKRAPRFKRN